ncbi:hypothetical protein SERLADRAFT_394086, partial [Serpula lacrymans var. lacrymans S7.9]
MSHPTAPPSTVPLTSTFQAPISTHYSAPQHSYGYMSGNWPYQYPVPQHPSATQPSSTQYTPAYAYPSYYHHPASVVSPYSQHNGYSYAPHY